MCEVHALGLESGTPPYPPAAAAGGVSAGGGGEFVQQPPLPPYPSPPQCETANSFLQVLVLRWWQQL